MSKWHSIKDKLPKKSGEYLTIWDNNKRRILIDNFDNKYGGFYRITFITMGEVTYWRKLPKLPKVQNVRMKER